MSIEVTYSPGLLLLLAVPVSLYYGLTSYDPARGFRKRAMLCLRAAVILGVSLDLAGLKVVFPSRSERVCVYFLVDVSDSLSPRNLEAASQFIRSSLPGLGPGSLAGLITMAGAPVLEQRARGDVTADALLSRVQEARKRKAKGAEGRSETNLEAALDLALAAFPEGYAKRVVLLSDLNETLGQAERALERAREAHAEIDVVPLDRAGEHEVLLHRLDVPSEVKLGESFKITALASASRPCAVTVRLYRNGYLVGEKGGDAPLGLPEGVTPITFRQSLELPGRYLYGVKIQAADPDIPDDPDNNSVYAFTEVRGVPRVLLLGEAEEEMESLAAALRAARFEVESRDVHGVPQTLLDLQNYDAVVLANVPRVRLHENQLKLFRDYVHDFGGGLVMIGGRNSFGPGGYAGTPIEEVLPVTMRLTEKQSPSLALVIVVDTSKSMLYLPDPREDVLRADVEKEIGGMRPGPVRHALEALLARSEGRERVPGRDLVRLYHQLETLRGDEGLEALGDRLRVARLGGIDKPAIVRTAVHQVVDRLTEKDFLGVLTLGSYNVPPRWIIPVQKVLDREKLKKMAAEISSDTFSEALGSFHLAQAELARTEAAYRHLLLLSDGYLPASQGFAAYAAQLAADGLTVSAIGIGEGCNAPFLKQMARWGNGRYYGIRREAEVAGVFSRELDEFQKEVIVEGPVRAEKIRDHEALQGIDVDLAPQLFGYVRTKARLEAQVPLALEPEMDPLLAFGRYGSGRTAAFTSDARERWAEGWIQDWPRGFSMLWGQILVQTLRPRQGERLIPDVAIDGRHLRLAADAVDAGHQFMNGLETRCELYYLGKQGRVFSSSARTALAMPLAAPGRYAATHSVDKDGVYLARFVAREKSDADASRAASPEWVATTGLVVSSSREVSLFRANRSLAETMAAATGGRVGHDPAGVFRPSRASPRLRDYGFGCLILSCLLFLADCLARRWPAVQSFLQTRSRTARRAAAVLLLAALSAPRPSLQAEPAQPGGPDAEALFSGDELQDVEFRFRTRFSRDIKPLDQQRVLHAYRLPPGESPRIDGQIDRTEVWSRNRIDQPDLPPEEVRVDRTREAWSQVITGERNGRQTVVYTCYDAEHLYVCFVCEEPDERRTRMEKRPAHDVWWDDDVEVFFEIGDVNGSGQRFQFLANVADRTQYANNTYWDMSDWEWKGGWGAKRWILEMAIPFHSFRAGDYRYHGPPVRGELWGLKLCRAGSPVVEGGEERMYSVWQHIPVLDFTLPEYSGMLVFDDRNALLNGDFRQDADGDAVPDHWQLVKSDPGVQAELKLTADGDAAFQFNVRERLEAALVRQSFGVRLETFYEVRADLRVQSLTGEAALEIYEPGQEPIRSIRITPEAEQSLRFEFRADRDKQLTAAVVSRGGRGVIVLASLRIEQQLFTVPEGVFCLTNNSARKDLHISEVIARENEARKAKGLAPLPYEEGRYIFYFPGTEQPHFPHAASCRIIAPDPRGEGKPEKQVQAGWVPFGAGSLTEGRGPRDQSLVSYPWHSRFGTEVPEGVDLVFDLQRNYFIQMIEVFPMTSGLNGLDIFVRPEKADQEYLVWKLNGAGVLNPVKEVMIAKVRPLDSVARTVRLSLRFEQQFNLKEVLIWGQPAGGRPETEVRHFRWKDGITMPPRPYPQLMKPPDRPFIFPLPRELKYEEGAFEARPALSLIHADNDQDQRTAEILARDLRQLGIEARLAPDSGEMEAASGSIWLGTASSSPSLARRLAACGLEAAPTSPGPEGYVLAVRPDFALLAGCDPAGTVYARDAFLQLLGGGRGQAVRAPAVTVRDWPNVPVRAVHLFYFPGIDSALKTDSEMERIIRLFCRYRFNCVYLASIESPGRRRLAADYNVAVVSSVGAGAGGGAAAEFATDETYAHVTSRKFNDGSRVNPNPSHPAITYRFQNALWPLLQDPLSRYNHVGHDEMSSTEAGSRWNECRLCLRRGKKGGDLFAEQILREHDLLKQVRRETVTLNTVLTTHGEMDKDEYGGLNRAYPLLARDVVIDHYHRGSGLRSDPFYANTSGFERALYIWGRPRPGEYWKHEVTGYWMANWSSFSFEGYLDEFFGNSPYWPSRGALEAQFAWYPYEELAQAQPDREDLRQKDLDQLMALAGIRASELLQGYPFPAWRRGTPKSYHPVDLAPWANWSHVDEKLLDRQGWVDKGTNYDLRRLPIGRVEFAGVPFEILEPARSGGRSLVLLQNRPSSGAWPGALQSLRLPVQRKVASLLFLRTTMEAGGDAPVYEAHYSGGGYAVIPVPRHEWNGGGSLRAATRRDAWPAWLGDAPCGDPVVLYAFEWVNPYPETAVEEVALRFAGAVGQRHAEALFAVTVLEASPGDTEEWQARADRPPRLSLARPGVDGLPGPDERVVYGQAFEFPFNKPIVEKTLGKAGIRVLSARAFDPAGGVHSTSTSRGFVLPYFSGWAGPFTHVDSHGRGGVFEVTLETPINAQAFTLLAEGYFFLSLDVQAEDGRWKKMGEGWGHEGAGVQGILFPEPMSFRAWRIRLEAPQPAREAKIYHFAFHQV